MFIPPFFRQSELPDLHQLRFSYARLLVKEHQELFARFEATKHKEVKFIQQPPPWVSP